MKKVVINEKQRGFLFRNGKYSGLLGPGKYWCAFGREIEVSNNEFVVSSSGCPLETLLADEKIARSVFVADIPDGKLGLLFRDGRYSAPLLRGKHAFWNDIHKHEMIVTDISTPEIGDDVPRYIYDLIGQNICEKITVAEYERSRLFFDKKLVRVLEPGTYYFWSQGVTGVEVSVENVDMRLTSADIVGQEIMTQDKVTLRINFTCNYRVVDCVRILTDVDDYKEQLHVAAQLALRDYVGRYRLDEILGDKEGISAYVRERLREKEAELYIKIESAGVKDIILPGEIRDIMNTVLVAEKRAQANVITRREEVASTRSLLNTAKLMEENATLYKLKELEYIERICENVGSINLNGSGDILTQLLTLLKGQHVN